jgi:hypothetical protein
LLNNARAKSEQLLINENKSLSKKLKVLEKRSTANTKVRFTDDSDSDTSQDQTNTRNKGSFLDKIKSQP